MRMKDLIKLANEQAKECIESHRKFREIMLETNSEIKYKKVFSIKDMEGFMEIGYSSGFSKGYLYSQKELV